MATTSDTRARLRAEIAERVAALAELAPEAHAFDPAAPKVPYAGRVLGATELNAMVGACLDGWLTAGPETKAFERVLAKRLSRREAAFTNSGSSANLLALLGMTSEAREQPLRPGDEVITAAAGFPTTVAPILQAGAVPVYVDSKVGTYNPTVEWVQAARTPKTRGVILAHALGNPFDAATLRRWADDEGLFLIEDTCDALGGRLDDRPLGSFGHAATLSFYPAHHITTGEGGAVLTSDPKLGKAIRSFRDWGRDCWCPTGRDNTCGKRFDAQYGDLPAGYDHKYVYSRAGYNLKATDIQAALGRVQLERLSSFHAARCANFDLLHRALAPFEDWLSLPQWDAARAEPGWFAYPITVRDKAPFSRTEMVRFLQTHGVATRNFFAGNLVRQPGFKRAAHRVAMPLDGADKIMSNTFFVGVFPGLGEDAMAYMIETIERFMTQSTRPGK